MPNGPFHSIHVMTRLMIPQRRHRSIVINIFVHFTVYWIQILATVIPAKKSFVFSVTLVSDLAWNGSSSLPSAAGPKSFIGHIPEQAKEAKEGQTPHSLLIPVKCERKNL